MSDLPKRIIGGSASPNSANSSEAPSSNQQETLSDGRTNSLTLRPKPAQARYPTNRPVIPAYTNLQLQAHSKMNQDYKQGKCTESKTIEKEFETGLLKDFCQFIREEAPKEIEKNLLYVTVARQTVSVLKTYNSCQLYILDTIHKGNVISEELKSTLFHLVNSFCTSANYLKSYQLKLKQKLQEISTSKNSILLRKRRILLAHTKNSEEELKIYEQENKIVLEETDIKSKLKFIENFVLIELRCMANAFMVFGVSLVYDHQGTSKNILSEIYPGETSVKETRTAYADFSDFLLDINESSYSSFTERLENMVRIHSDASCLMGVAEFFQRKAYVEISKFRRANKFAFEMSMELADAPTSMPDKKKKKPVPKQSSQKILDDQPDAAEPVATPAPETIDPAEASQFVTRVPANRPDLVLTAKALENSKPNDQLQGRFMRFGGKSEVCSEFPIYRDGSIPHRNADGSFRHWSKHRSDEAGRPDSVLYGKVGGRMGFVIVENSNGTGLGEENSSNKPKRPQLHKYLTGELFSTLRIPMPKGWVFEAPVLGVCFNGPNYANTADLEQFNLWRDNPPSDRKLFLCPTETDCTNLIGQLRSEQGL